MFSMNSCFCTCRNWTSEEQFSSGFQTTSREDPKRLFYMDMYLRNFPTLRECPRAVYWGRFSSTFMLLTYTQRASRYNVSLPSFADDMTLYCSRTSLKSACSDVSTALTTISTELDSRGLKINCEKTSAMSPAHDRTEYQRQSLENHHLQT